MKTARWTAVAAAMACSGGGLMAQTAINLGNQSRNVDFASASFTRPAKTGAGLPATCTVGEMYFRTDAVPGQNLYGCTGPDSWSLMSSTGGGGGAATAMAQLTDFQVTRSSSTVLAFNSGCSAGLPCNFRFGSTVVRLTGAATATLSATTGATTAYLYISSAGNLTVGYDSGLTLVCSGCVQETGVTAFPSDSIPLYTWAAGTVSGQWDASGFDYRAVLSSQDVRAGSGLSKVTNPSTGAVTLSVDSSLVGLRVSVPATATSACSVGHWAISTSYVYFCAATNTWRRVAVSSW